MPTKQSRRTAKRKERQARALTAFKRAAVRAGKNDVVAQLNKVGFFYLPERTKHFIVSRFS